MLTQTREVGPPEFLGLSGAYIDWISSFLVWCRSLDGPLWHRSLASGLRKNSQNSPGPAGYVHAGETFTTTTAPPRAQSSCSCRATDATPKPAVSVRFSTHVSNPANAETPRSPRRVGGLSPRRARGMCLVAPWACQSPARLRARKRKNSPCPPHRWPSAAPVKTETEALNQKSRHVCHAMLCRRTRTRTRIHAGRQAGRKAPHATPDQPCRAVAAVESHRLRVVRRELSKSK